jgi:hypothetical protein
MNPETLEHLLVETGTLTPMQLAFARRDALLRKKRLAPMLIELGLFSDTHFAEWTARSTSFPFFNPIPTEGLAELVTRVPAAVAREYEVVPVGVDGDELIVATIDPLDRRAIEALNSATGMKIRPVIARYGDLVQVLERFYPPTEPATEPESNSESAPFEFGSETLLLSQQKPFAVEEEFVGSRTQAFTPRPDVPLPEPPPPPAPVPRSTSQLDRMEENLDSLTKSIQKIERKLDAIDAILARILTRS